MKKDADRARVHFGDAAFADLLAHLRKNELEQAAFLYLERDGGGDEVRVREVETLAPADFIAQEADYLELTDEARARGLRRAHELGLALGEAHSHPRQGKSCFSPTDLRGLWDFAPHVWWRRRGGPFVALVFGRHDLDGLAWVDAADRVRRIEGVVVGERMHRASGESWRCF